MGEPKESQQEPKDDSLLQTPQPDQPMPREDERRSDAAEDSPPVDVDVEVNVDNPAAPADAGESS